RRASNRPAISGERPEPRKPVGHWQGAQRQEEAAAVLLVDLRRLARVTTTNSLRHPAWPEGRQPSEPATVWRRAGGACDHRFGSEAASVQSQPAAWLMRKLVPHRSGSDFQRVQRAAMLPEPFP